MKIRKTKQDMIVDVIVYLSLILLVTIIILPFMQVITISLSATEDINKFGFHFIPNFANIDFSGYKKVFTYDLIWTGYLNTIIRILVGSSLSIFLTILGAYPLSKRYLPHHTFWTAAVVFTMYFSGGLVPTYLLVRNLKLMNTIWALILPGVINTYNMIIMRNFFMSIPEDLEESARIDGANEFIILFRIILPVSKSILATIALWYIVADWNQWYEVMVYIQDQSKYTLQYVLRRILLEGQAEEIVNDSREFTVNSEAMKMATVVVSTLPIVCIYPFIQKYFVQGVMVGSLKG